jgi:hypothetical protein
MPRQKLAVVALIALLAPTSSAAVCRPVQALSGQRRGVRRVQLSPVQLERRDAVPVSRRQHALCRAAAGSKQQRVARRPELQSRLQHQSGLRIAVAGSPEQHVPDQVVVLAEPVSRRINPTERGAAATLKHMFKTLGPYVSR